MANRRMISKSVSISTKANLLSDFAALLFTWMIPHADDYGILDGDPGTINALVVPRRKKTDVQVEKALSEIQEIGLIWWYEYKGKKYIQFINWEEHQEGLHKRTASKMPLYQDCAGDSENFREIPGNSPLREPKRTEPKGREEKGTEGKQICAPLVTMTEDEKNKLIDKFGAKEALERIERLSLYKQSTGKIYRSDFATILAWARKDENQPCRASPEVTQQKSGGDGLGWVTSPTSSGQS